MTNIYKHSPLPWSWSDDFRELRDAAGDSVMGVYIEMSLEPGEGIDESGVDVSEADAAEQREDAAAWMRGVARAALAKVHT